jgi:luciferase family oxidoreductase group 1
MTGDIDLPIRATPGYGAQIEMWMLGSSLFGASLAAKLGLPYAFAAHFAPDHLDDALAVYRRDFQPSAALARPHVMVAMNVFAADTAEEAELIASSQAQSFVALRTGNPGKLPPPVAGYRARLPAPAQAMLAHLGQAAAIGTPAEVRAAITSFIARTGADEIMLCGATFDAAARIRSLELTFEAMSAPVLA